MAYIFDYLAKEDYLAHHGIKGQKWGVRRFQNANGTWTNAGKERYGDAQPEKISRKEKRALKENEKRTEIEKRLKNAKSAKEAEDALSEKIYYDLKRNQKILTRTINSVTGKNWQIADDLVKKLSIDTMVADGKNTRSTMTIGQKFVDALSGGNAQRYETSGYKKLGQAYDSYKAKYASEKKAMRAATRYSDRLYAQRREQNKRRQASEQRRNEALMKDYARRKELGLV